MSYNSFSRPRSLSSRPYYSSSQPQRGGNRGKRRGAYIDPNKFINKATAVAEQVVYDAKHTFPDFALASQLQRNIAARGYLNPTPIQDQAIPPVLEGRDLVGLANTGTGKTAAFLLPILNKLNQTGKRESVLIMAPTRELAQQINDEFLVFSQHMHLFATVCVGGMNIGRQIAQLRRQPHIIIGTPGRLRDLYTQRCLNLSEVTTLVLDEADRMLDMGFITDIRFLVNELPKARQSLFFSATTSPETQNLIREFLNDPVTVSVRTSETSDHVEQNIIRAESKEHKVELLHEMLAKPEFEKVLIFGETKHGVQRLADSLTKVGHAAEAIHGNKSQPQRQRALAAFKNNQVKILVATDVAARGLDIPNVSHVINFDQPETYQDYIHRIGRTGRAGNQGNALTFVGGV